MKCVCPMGGDRTCPDNCLIAVWHSLPEDQRTKERRRPIVETLAKQKYTQQAIGIQLGVDQRTVGRDLETLGILPNVKGQGKDTLGRKKSTGRPKNKLQPKRRKNTAPTAESAAQQILDGEMTYPEAEKETGFSNVVLRSAVAREEGRRDPDIDRSELSMSAQEKLDAAVRAYKRKLDVDFEQRVSSEIAKRLDEMILPQWNKLIADARKLYDQRRGITDKATFNAIRRALHPDSRNSISDKMLATAFDAFMSLEKYLLDEKNSPTEIGTGMPRTLAEWEAAKQRATAERRAKRHNSQAVRPR